MKLAMLGRIIVVSLSYLVTLFFIAIVTFVIVWFFAGPHAGILPSWLESALLAFGWWIVFLLPILIAYRIWQHLNKRSMTAE